MTEQIFNLDSATAGIFTFKCYSWLRKAKEEDKRLVRHPKAEMVSGIFLGSVLRGADRDQQAADEDVSVPEGKSCLAFTLIRACAEHSYIKQKGKMSFMCRKRFSIKHVAYANAV